MEFRFEDTIAAKDIWKLSMRRMYHSFVGVCNVILAGAVIAMTVHFWESQVNFRAMFIFICILVPVIQPVVIYKRAARQVNALPKDMVLDINKTGIHITANEEKIHIPWNMVRGMIEEIEMVILVVDDGRGYMIANRVLGARKEEFIGFVKSKIK